MKIKIILLILFFLWILPVSARENVDYWYIKKFEVEIKLNKDSSAVITENIIADCGNADNKHGIFRILPKKINTFSKYIKNPIELISITDFNGNPLKYQVIENFFDNTITWKIGDPNITVKGENNYRIIYKIKNVVYTENDFSEFYWNLSGNFWDIEIDSFFARVILPSELNQNNVKIKHYSGYRGDTGSELSVYRWLSENEIGFYSTKTILPGQGITALLTFPKDIFIVHQPNFWDYFNWSYLWIFLPFFVFFYFFSLWKKYGRDPKIDKAITPEFNIPENLNPLRLGLLMTNGSMRNYFITATIINLAVRKKIIIREIKKKSFIFDKIDYELERIDKSNTDLNPEEREIIDKIFTKDKVLLSDLKNKFYVFLDKIKKKAISGLESDNLITVKGLSLNKYLIIIGIFVCFFSLFFYFVFPFFSIALTFSGIIILFFGIIMHKRTKKGAELNWKIKGFRLFMETAEKYRQRFNEESGLFDKLLPYAIVFKITDKWIDKMKNIYDDNEKSVAHFSSWYVTTIGGGFNIDNFSSKINNLSTAISSNISSPSSNSSGSSGGGGGGGGGGGW